RGRPEPRRRAAPLRRLPRAPSSRVPAGPRAPAAAAGRAAARSDGRAPRARGPAGVRPRVRVVPEPGAPGLRARLLTQSRPLEIAYDEQGLVPVVVQDWRTGEVLTLAYANAEAVRRTRETGQLHLW